MVDITRVRSGLGELAPVKVILVVVNQDLEDVREALHAVEARLPGKGHGLAVVLVAAKGAQDAKAAAVDDLQQVRAVRQTTVVGPRPRQRGCRPAEDARKDLLTAAEIALNLRDGGAALHVIVAAVVDDLAFRHLDQDRLEQDVAIGMRLEFDESAGLGCPEYLRETFQRPARHIPGDWHA